MSYIYRKSRLFLSSQNTGLSQPAPSLSHRQRLQWLQRRRCTGLWAQCDDCQRWRYLPDVLDAHDLPKTWICTMNPDKSAADCSVPEAPIRLKDEEDLIHGEYSVGSLVWARLTGWPWWPAMVDDDPDTEQYYWLDGYSDIPTHYNVTYFDSSEVTRSWLAPENLQPFGPNKKFHRRLPKDKKTKSRLEVAIAQAEDAEKLPQAARLAKYSFISRYSNPINPPKTFNKNELVKFKNKLKREYNITFSDSSEDSDDGSDNVLEVPVNKDSTTVIKKGGNVLLVGSPKSVKKDNKIMKVPKKIRKVEQDTATSNTNTNESERNEDLEQSKSFKNDNKTMKVPKKIRKVEQDTATNNTNTNESDRNEDLEQSASMAVQVDSSDSTTICDEKLSQQQKQKEVEDFDIELNNNTSTLPASPKSVDFDF